MHWKLGILCNGGERVGPLRGRKEDASLRCQEQEVHRSCLAQVDWVAESEKQ